MKQNHPNGPECSLDVYNDVMSSGLVVVFSRREHIIFSRRKHIVFSRRECDVFSRRKHDVFSRRKHIVFSRRKHEESTISSREENTLSTWEGITIIIYSRRHHYIYSSVQVVVLCYIKWFNLRIRAWLSFSWPFRSWIQASGCCSLFVISCCLLVFFCLLFVHQLLLPGTYDLRVRLDIIRFLPCWFPGWVSNPFDIVLYSLVLAALL